MHSHNSVGTRIIVQPALQEVVLRTAVQAENPEGCAAWLGRKLYQLFCCTAKPKIFPDVEDIAREIDAKFPWVLRDVIFSYYCGSDEIAETIRRNPNGLDAAFGASLVPLFKSIQHYVFELDISDICLVSRGRSVYENSTCSKIENLVVCFPKLRSLKLKNCGIGIGLKGFECRDKCLKQLSKLSELEHLNLSRNGVSSSLKQLVPLQNLETLILEDCTNIEDSEVDELERRIAGLYISFWDIEPVLPLVMSPIRELSEEAQIELASISESVA